MSVEMNMETLVKLMMEQDVTAMQQALLVEDRPPDSQADFSPLGTRSRPTTGDWDYTAESARYDNVRELTQTGNGIKLTELLSQWSELGWLRDWRNEEDLTLYVDAITDGYLDVINVLLSFDIPLGDALIRAIDVEFDDAIKSICRYLEAREDIRESILTCNCDNDDFHPAITPVILAAQRNNFNSVKLLVELGAEITEPSLSQGGDVTLTQALSTLHIYRALSQPAYILATQTDVFGHAFGMSKRLKLLSRTWEDFGAEYEQMARGVEVFAGEMLGQSASTEEILALFRYHQTDQYRDLEGKQHHLAKLFEAIKYQQKEFIAHPHSQKAIIVQFYRNLLDWNEKGLLHQILLVLFVLLGYPIICLIYIFFPVRSVINFARLPYVMMMMKAGSGFTFLIFIIAVTVIDKHDYPQTVDTLHAFILVWIIGLAWLHIKTIAKHGPSQYVADNVNLHELVIMGLYFTVFILQWDRGGKVSEVIPVRRSMSDAVSDNAFSKLQNQVASAFEDLSQTLSDAIVEGVRSYCQYLNTTTVPIPSSLSREIETSFHSHLSELQETIELDQLEPIIVAGALFGITVTVSFLRLLNILLVSDSLGPLRISLGDMVGDIVKFFAIFTLIWFAFAIGLFQNFYAAGQSATRACIQEGEEPESCQMLVGFSTFMGSMKDLYWSLYGFTEIDVLVLSSMHSVAETVGTSLFAGYLIVAVLVLLNALIGMLSNTYNRTAENADMEWKFHRAVVWASYLRPVGTLPPPFNLIPSVKSMYRHYMYIVGLRRKVVSKKDLHSKREREDYRRVLKLVSTRYIQTNLSTESQNNENARPRDLQTLRNDILAFKFHLQDRLENVGNTLDVTGRKTSTVHQKLTDLNPLNEQAEELLNQSSTLTNNVVTLFDKTDNLKQTQTVEISQRDQDASEMRRMIAELRTEVAGLNISLVEEIAGRNRLDANLNTVIRGLEEDKIGLTDTIHRLSLEKSDLKTQVDKLQSEAHVLETESIEQKDNISKLRNEIEKLTACHAAGVTEWERKEQEHGKIQEENKRLSDAIDMLKQDKADLANKVRKLSEDSYNLKAVPSTLAYAVAAHQVEIKKLIGSHSAELQEKNKLEAKLKITILELKEENRDLTNSVKELGEEKADLDRKISELTEGSNSLETEYLTLKDQLVELQFRIEELKNGHLVEVQARDQEKMQLKDTIRRLEENISLSEALKDEIARLEKKSSELQIKTKDLRISHKADMDSRNQQEAILNNTIRRLQEANADLKQTVRELNESKTDLTRRMGKLRKETGVLEENSGELRSAVDRVKLENKRLKGSHSTTLAEIKKLKSDHSAELAERNQQKVKLNDVIRGLQEEKHKLSVSLHGLKGDKAELAKLVGELNTELYNLPHKPVSSKQGASQLDQSNSSLLHRIVGVLEESFAPKKERTEADGSNSTTSEQARNSKDGTHIE